MPNAIDLLQHAVKPDLTPEATAMIMEQAHRMWNLEQEIKEMEAVLELRKEEHKLLSRDKLPGLMNQYGIPALPLKAGYTLLVESVFKASLPAESTIDKADDEDRPMLEKRRADGLEWLKANKAEDIIKNEVIIKLGKGQVALAKAVLTALRKFKFKLKPARLNFEQKETVHQGQLSKLLREKRDNGVDIPIDTFAVFDGKEAVIKAPKKGKGEKQNG